MSKLLELVAAVLGGLGLGIVIAVLLIDRFGPFCPSCNGRLITEKGSAVCTKCGVRLRLEEP